MYSIEDLNKRENHLVALSRYLHKFNNHRKEVKKLKLHEKHFMFSNMQALISTKDGLAPTSDKTFKNEYELWKYLESNGLATKPYSLYEIEEAKDYLFYIQILTYGQNLNFLSPIYGAYGLLSKEDIEKDKVFFEKKILEWESLLFSNKGSYVPYILVEYNRKKSIIEEQRRKYIIGHFKFEHKIKELLIVSFYIFYRIKHFFENQKEFYYVFKIQNLKFVFNIYSYVHILSRHYMPSVNEFDLQKSFNDDIPFFDIYNIGYFGAMVPVISVKPCHLKIIQLYKKVWVIPASIFLFSVIRLLGQFCARSSQYDPRWHLQWFLRHR